MSIIEQLFRLLAPYECLECGREGRLLCLWCSQERLESVPERCYRCYRLSPSYKTCSVCRHYSVLNHVWVRVSYNETPRKIIHALKFTYAQDAAKIIAEELHSMLPKLDPSTILVHVPAATSHVRLRGFDQSALIARQLSRLTKLPHVNGLSRLGQQRQVGAARETRRAQMAKAFRPLSVSVIKNAHILLVDDVLTTGSTLEAAAKTLKLAGAKKVDAIVFAQAR